MPTIPHSCALCTYCRRPRPETRNHVPPKGLFSKPYPADLITIPCCAKCNAAFARDDEYFRVALLTSEWLSELEATQSALDSVARSLQRAEAAGFAQLIASSFSIRENDSEGTADLVFTLDKPRIFRVVERIIHGLYYHELRRPVPASQQVLAALHIAEMSDLMWFVEGIPMATVWSAAGGAFEYTFAKHRVAGTRIWLANIYNRMSILGFVTSSKGGVKAT